VALPQVERLRLELLFAEVLLALVLALALGLEVRRDGRVGKELRVLEERVDKVEQVQAAVARVGLLGDLRAGETTESAPATRRAALHEMRDGHAPRP